MFFNVVQVLSPLSEQGRYIAGGPFLQHIQFGIMGLQTGNFRLAEPAVKITRGIVPTSKHI